ncbi:MAG: 5'/3'-nucleotidase SurE [Firmicutes bacterium]|nr:5'/3'-nucleotidase SurE [Bacillota bacterium]
MRILLTNDDGIYAPGIKALARALEGLGELIVAAPDRERSATGHSITVFHPIRVDRTNIPETTARGWIVEGTPADCVKLAICALLDEPPDLVVSGINRGPNLGTDVLYSGTVSAAVEGIILGVPAIAVSLTTYDYDADYSFAASFTRRLCEEYSRQGLTPDTLLNVNIPPLDEESVAGVKVTKLGVRRYENVFEERKDPRGKSYYWLAGDVIDDLEDPDSDVVAIHENKVSITPIHFDLTNYAIMEDIQRRLSGMLR